MKVWTKPMLCVIVVLACAGPAWTQDVLQVRDLFNGKDLSGWVNVNCAPDTWSVKDGRSCARASPSASCAPTASTRTSSCPSSGST